MVIKKISIDQLEKIPWKNGGGLTREIAIFPENSKMASSDFLLRLSCAEINTNGPFSRFENCDRLLFIWKGEGVALNNTVLKKDNFYHFNGEENVLCKLLNDKVVDIGIIYNRLKIKTEMSFFKLNPSERKEIKTTMDYSFLLILEGKVSIFNQSFTEGDVLVFENELNYFFVNAFSSASILFLESKVLITM